MFDRDGAFLNDYMQCSFLQHIIAAQALYEAVRNAESAATTALAIAEDIDTPAATALVKEFGYAPRVQKIVVARLYAELAAALEDLGALCFAVRGRADGGIFKRYLRSTTADACNAFDYVIQNPAADLHSLLDLPSLQEIQPALTPTDYAACVGQYTDLALHLRSAAESYRTVPQSFKPQPVPSMPASGWENDTNIILNIEDPGDNLLPPKGGVMAQVYNKLKHRFTVVENLPSIVNVPDTPGEMTVAYHPINQGSIDRLMQALRDGVMAGAEIAALMILLDTHAIPV